MQRRVLQALHDLGAATTAELCEYAYGRTSNRRLLYIRRRSTRAALHAIGAIAVDRRYHGGLVWQLPHVTTYRGPTLSGRPSLDGVPGGQE
jgi:hypothetical protein